MLRLRRRLCFTRGVAIIHKSSLLHQTRTVTIYPSPHLVRGIYYKVYLLIIFYMEFLLLIGVLFLWASYSGLSNRVKNIERHIDSPHTNLHSNPTLDIRQTPGQIGRPIVHEDIVAPNTVPGQTMYRPASFTPQSVRPEMQEWNREVEHPKDDIGNSFIEWLKADFLMKLGALFLLMGLGWFMTYAILNEWIDEQGRIVLGILFGTGVMVLGVWRIKTREHQGALFTVLGSTIVLLTVFAARSLYGIFDKYSALGLILLAIIFVTFVSLKYRRNSLALASLIMAGLAPYLVSSNSGNMTEHLSYLFVITMGTLWVVYITGWRNLTFSALVITFLVILQYMGMGYDNSEILLWLFIFTAVFFVANIVSLIRQRGAVISIVHLWTALGTALLLIIGVFGLAEKESQSLLFVAWMLVFSVGSYLVYRSTTAKSPFYVYSGTSIALLAAATIAELDGTLLTIAFTIEIAVLVIIAEMGNLGKSTVQTLGALFVIPILMSVDSIVASEWYSGGIMHEHFFNLVILTLVLGIVGLFLNERNKARGDIEDHLGITFVTLSALYALMLVWLVFHALFSDDMAMTFILIIYTVIGIALYFNGKSKGYESLVIAGGTLLGFVGLRLLLVEVWQMELGMRIVAFVVIGVLLLLTAFMSRTPKVNHQ
jgi:uncharacterized membrane protein